MREPSSSAGLTLRLRSVDSFLAGRDDVAADAAAPVRFTPAGMISPLPVHDMFGERRTAADQRAAEQFQRQAKGADGIPYGVLEFRDVHLAMSTGVIIDAASGICWHGHALGWGRELLASQLGAQLGALPGSTPDEVVVPSRRFEDAPRRAELCLVAAAGYTAYGHWLLDVIPRLRAARQLGMDGSGLCAPAIGDWGVQLARAVGVDIRQRYVPPVGHVVRVDRLLVPTYIRWQTVVDPRAANAVWTEVAAGLDAGSKSHAGAASGRVYVSRARWSRGRTLANNVEVEAWMRRQGYRIVDPQTLGLAEQAAVFGNATEIVGEDGSGVHNVVFSPAGARLSVIAMGRINLFHAGIANAKRQALRYIEATPTDDGTGWALPLDRLQDALDA